MPRTPERVDLTSDHRGEPCALVRDLADTPSIFPFRRAEAPIEARTRRLLLYALASWIAAVVLLVGLTSLAVVRLSGVGWRAFAMVWAPTVAVILLAFFASAVFQRMARRRWSAGGQAASAALLAARGWCPACRAWLASATRDADGLTPCPACGAAWKVGNEQGCPGCGYDMRHVPASAGPLAICPECATLSVANQPGGSRIDGDGPP